MSNFGKILLGVATTLALAAPAAHAEDFGAVYTASNDPAGNEILIWNRNANGRLTAGPAIATGGLGTGGSLGNQSGIVLDPSARWMFAVNAGDGSLSSLRVQEDTLELVDNVSSGGFRPVSVTVFGTLVYVLNAGDPDDPANNDNIAGFRFNLDGTLSPLAGSERPLSADNTAPAQIAFNREGTVLFVTEKATNALTTYVVGSDGLPTAGPISRNSARPTPFGFEFGDRDVVFVSEANQGGPGFVVPYRVDRETGAVSPAVDIEEIGQNATCWVVISDNGRRAYVTNTGSGTVTALEVNFDGTMDPIGNNGHDRNTGAGPLDLVLSRDGRSVYTLNSGDDNITHLRVRNDGRLRRSGTFGPLPDGANGLAVR